MDFIEPFNFAKTSENAVLEQRGSRFELLKENGAGCFHPGWSGRSVTISFAGWNGLFHSIQSLTIELLGDMCKTSLGRLPQ